MYAVVECSKELKNKRYLDGVELNFIKKEKSIVIKNVDNLVLFNTISEHYEDKFKDYITKVVKDKELVIIFFRWGIHFRHSKTNIVLQNRQ